MDENLNTNVHGLHCLGDSSGWTRGLMMASAMGVLMARGQPGTFRWRTRAWHIFKTLDSRGFPSSRGADENPCLFAGAVFAGNERFMRAFRPVCV